MLNFDLQLFGDEENVSSAEKNSTVEDSTEQQELPEGFEGLEEYKDEILADMAEMQKSEENSQAEDSSGEISVGQKVPYERFKSKVDEVAALKAQIDEMKRQGVQAEQPQTSPPTQPQRQQNFSQPRQPIQMPQIQVTPEFMNAFKTATNNLAMQMTKFTPEQVKQIEEYGEEGDADAERWNFAKQQAAQFINNKIEQVQIKQAQQAQAFLDDHNAAVQHYNDFASREMQTPEFQNVVNFATGEYFDSLPDNAQKVIANSYVRIERQTASPAEVELVLSFYQQAKAAYQNKNLPKPQKNNPAPKTKFPKADQLNGANGNGVQTMTAADLEKIIDSTEDFEKLDPKIKKLFER